MAYAPCKNPNCKSYGRPHPNCKCYGEMAEGGEVSGCNGPHHSGCEYFSNDGVLGTIGHLNPHHAIAGHIAHRGIVGVLKMAKEQDLDKYDKSVHRGHTHIEEAIDRVLRNEKHPHMESREKHHKAIDDWITRGGITQDIQHEMHSQNSTQMMADGGPVVKTHEGVLHGHPVEHAYPDQNILLQQAKGRVSNYLSSMKPQDHAPRLAFDAPPDQREQKKAYAKAVKVADHPMSVLHAITNGTIQMDDVKHLKAMYPEVLDSVQKKITEKVIHAQLDGKRPSRKVRQGLSLLMGTALSGEYTPGGIQAAQSAFAGKQAPQQQGQPTSGPSPQGPSKKSALSKSDSSYLTGGQALAKRQQRVN